MQAQGLFYLDNQYVHEHGESLRLLATELMHMLSENEISKCDVVAEFLLQAQIKLFGPQAFQPALPQTTSTPASAISIFKNHRPKKLPGEIIKALKLIEKYPNSIQLIPGEPSSKEMLESLKNGIRIITLKILPEEWQPPFGKHGCPVEFILHDLQHTCRFLEDDHLKQLQIGWSHGLWKITQTNLLEPFQSDPEFKTRWDYLISDMGSHPFHGWLTLKSAIRDSMKTKNGLPRKSHLSPEQESKLEMLLRIIAATAQWQWPITPEQLERDCS